MATFSQCAWMFASSRCRLEDGHTGPHDYRKPEAIEELPATSEKMEPTIVRTTSLAHPIYGDCVDCWHRWRYHGPSGCGAPKCPCSEPGTVVL